MEKDINGTELMTENSSFIKGFPCLEVSVGHVPDYNEEEESEVPGNWYHPLKD